MDEGKNNQILSHVYRISALLTEPTTTDRVLESIVQTVKKDLNFNRCSVYLVDRATNCLECKYITGFSPHLEKFVMERPFNLARHECMETKVATTGEPILIKNFNSDPSVTELDRKVTKRMGRGCTLYVPLKIKGDVIGILGVDKKHGEPEIDDDEFESLSILANYASIIIENSKLLQDLVNEKKFSENVLKSSVNGILTVDIEGRITSLNPAVEEAFQANKEDMLKRFIWDVFDSPEWVKNTKNIVAKHVNIKGWEFALKTKGQDEAILNISTSHITNEAGSLIGFTFVIQDVTNEKRRDHYLQRVNRLVSLGELAAGVAHEIRNPLTGIGVVLDILGKKRRSKAELELINDAKSEIVRLEKLISDLLTFARPRDLNFDLVDLRTVITSIFSLVKEQCDQKKIKLVIKVSDDIGRLFLDRERIKQGLLNIVINAINAMPDGGELTIEAVNCKNETDSGAAVKIVVSDTGTGISNENKNRIFDPFFTTSNEGTGLGLSITHSIVKEHDGSIRVESEEGRGTEFTIILPCRQPRHLGVPAGL
ncbi:MAG TPA: ATP-binding protein [Syntrophales bacterium]|nr:PAS domain S-box protein [Syntrophobacterales bacterium]HRT27543.1 ATP-binding protein [Syntrophales bacterium]HRT69878.1 ATP-binding protein [Syntrophales bacterium]